VNITDSTVRKLVVPTDPPISDSQTDDHVSGITYLELETDTGEVGIGFGRVDPTIPVAVMREQFKPVHERLVGESPFHLRGQMGRPRGGSYSRAATDRFERAVDFALWDLCGKHLDMPIYKLLGATDPSVPAYVSGLLFSQDDDLTRSRYERYRELGFTAAKVKVGYPTIQQDLDRLSLVQDTLGSDSTLMIDANEAWSPKEAIRRAHAYRDAGFDIYWHEDPVLRDDVEGLRNVAEALPFAHINAGEYVNYEGKLELLENRAVDVLNLRNGLISTSLDAAAVAHGYGVLTHVGHAPGNIGVHVAAALPELTFIEWWDRPWQDLVEEPVRIEDGQMIAPDRPGHGITLATDALEQYEKD